MGERPGPDQLGGYEGETNMKSIAIVPAVIGLSVASVIGHSSQTSRTLTRDAVVDAIRAGVSDRKSVV